jgi:hypothetical protein
MWTRTQTPATEEDDEAPVRDTRQGLVLPGVVLAENTRFELVRGCPQHAFQLFTMRFGWDQERPDLRWMESGEVLCTSPHGSE